MPRIKSAAALRPFRLIGLRASQLRYLSQEASGPATTYDSPPKPKPTTTTTTTPARPTQYSSSYKRPATTTSYSSKPSTPYKPSSSTSPPPSPTTAAKAPTTAYAAVQLDPFPRTPYQPPPNAPPLPDAPAAHAPGQAPIDWSSSFHGLSTLAFAPEVARILMAPIPFEDVEIKPDGIIYLPEIKYRRILNTAFGPGGWGMAPRGELAVGDKVVTREYALLVHGRFIAQARGECGFFGGDDGIATAGEGCKSNALMRCCKDLGIASELWDPRYIREYKKKYAQEIWVEHVTTKKKRIITLRKGDEPAYPYKKS